MSQDQGDAGPRRPADAAGGGGPPDGVPGTDPTARLSDVVFAYDRDADLPDPDAIDDYDADPDARGGAVLRGVDMSVPAGSFTVVMGASGGGKSTLLRTFNAIIPNFITGSFDGDVDVLGRDATDTRVAEMAQVVGMVLQDYEAQLFGTSVAAEVAFGPENLAVDPDEIRPRIDRSLDLVGLGDLDHRRPPEALSGGQKQRLVFAGVAANHPRLLVLDEPTSDLDPVGSRETLSVVRSLADARNSGDGAGDGSGTGPADADAADAGSGDPDAGLPAASTDEAGGWRGPETIVAVTHKIEEALLADRAVLLRGGRVYREGPARSVFTDVEALRAARVEVPPVVDAFDRLGYPRAALPLTPDEAVERFRADGLDWTPPTTRSRPNPGVPAGAGASPGDVVFELSDVVHDYETDRGSVRAVDGVDLTVRDGEVLAVVGHNGSGKTTLAKHLNGLLAPDEGTARWRDRPIPDVPMAELGRSIGYVFQNPDHQIFAETVEKEVAFGPENFGLSGDALDEAVADAVATVELDGLEDADPFNLSKGQRQRVALASILATDPEVIVFDEPTTGLDAAQQRRFMDLVADLNREAGLTVVMVTHSMDTVTRYAPRTVVMEDGRKVADGPTRELFADGDRLADWQLTAPGPVELSNRLAAVTDQPAALPALSVEELVAGIDGVPAAPASDAVGDSAGRTVGSGERDGPGGGSA